MVVTVFYLLLLVVDCSINVKVIHKLISCAGLYPPLSYSDYSSTCSNSLLYSNMRPPIFFNIYHIFLCVPAASQNCQTFILDLSAVQKEESIGGAKVFMWGKKEKENSKGKGKFTMAEN